MYVGSAVNIVQRDMERKPWDKGQLYFERPSMPAYPIPGEWTLYLRNLLLWVRGELAA